MVIHLYKVNGVRHLSSKLSGIKLYENQHDDSEVITSVQTDRPILIGTPPSVSQTVFERLVKTLPIL